MAQMNGKRNRHIIPYSDCRLINELICELPLLLSLTTTTIGTHDKLALITIELTCTFEKIQVYILN